MKKKKKNLTLTEALALQGLDNIILAKILTRNLRGPQSLKALDMIFKIRGDYKMNFLVSGQINHAHAHALLPPDEKAARIKALEERSKISSSHQDILDSIAPPISPSGGQKKESSEEETVDS